MRFYTVKNSFIWLLLLSSCALKKHDCEISASLKIDENIKADFFQKSAYDFINQNHKHHYSCELQNSTQLDSLFDGLDTLKKSPDYSAKALEYFQANIIYLYNNNEYRVDCSVLDAAILKKDIDYALSKKSVLPWGNTVSSFDFNNYVLPYKYGYEAFKPWREFFFEKYAHKILEAGIVDSEKAHYFIKKDFEKIFLQNDKISSFFSYDLDWVNLYKLGLGTCSQRSYLELLACRALTLPVAYYEVPVWGNYPLGHAWVGLVTKEGKAKMNNQNTPENTRDIVDVSSYKEEIVDFVKKDKKFANEQVRYKRTVPKVYKRMFAKPAGGDHKGSFLEDVTAQFVDCKDVNIELSDLVSSINTADLCVFGYRGSWRPIAKSIIESNGVCQFKDVGTNIVYNIGQSIDGRLQVIESPFLLKETGEKEYFKPDHANLKTVVLKKKYPLNVTNAYRASNMKGGVFQGANKKDFSDAIDLFSIEETPLYRNVIPLNGYNNKYQYIRYVGSEKIDFYVPTDYCVELAELKIFTIVNGIKTKVDGKLLSSLMVSDENLKNIADNNPLTYYKNSGTKWVGLELDKQYLITEIEFWPRNDLNCIIPSDEYELFYWEKGWQSLGRKIASDYSIAFQNVPDNALLWLRNHSHGKEERIFVYKNGQQVWY